jgi:DNA-binding transcriptional LysR family regulator
MFSFRFGMDRATMAWNDRIGRRLKFRDLQMLMAVVEAGGIGKAAGRLNYSQPAISKAIAGLEHAFGKRLLDRGRKGIELTPYGDALVKCGSAVLDELRKGLASIEFLADPTAGQVRVGCIEPVFAGLVSSVIDRLARQHPRIEFQIEVKAPSVIYEELHARKIDFAIVQVRAPIDGEHLHIETLYEDPLVIVSGAQHPAANKRRIRIADLADEHWVLPPGNSLAGSLLAKTFRAEGLKPPKIAATTHSAYCRAFLAANGHFLTLIPSVMLRVQMKRMSLKGLPIKLRGNSRPIAVVTLKNRALSPVAQLFIEHARALAKTMAKDN